MEKTRISEISEIPNFSGDSEFGFFFEFRKISIRNRIGFLVSEIIGNFPKTPFSDPFRPISTPNHMLTYENNRLA